MSARKPQGAARVAVLGAQQGVAGSGKEEAVRLLMQAGKTYCAWRRTEAACAALSRDQGRLGLPPCWLFGGEAAAAREHQMRLPLSSQAFLLATL